MKVDLIHNVVHNNMVQDVLSEREKFQAMSSIIIQVANVYRWKKLVREQKGGYINYPEAQKLLGELRKGKALKEVRLVDGLVK
jgi:hypothetical protein